FLSPEGEAVPHEVVWGLFAFGDGFGGGYLRSIPSDRTHDGVVAGARGARGVPIISVEPV
ncbi:MAG TPA: hypothetical protein VGE98_07465, partial [Thermoanaerobaculia bacterium]